MILELTLFIVFSVMTYRIVAGVRREASILAEFNLPQSLSWLALLFPLGPLVLIVGTRFLGFPLNFVVAACCYLPAMLIARRQGHKLETAGTDRVQPIQSTITQAFGTGLVGLLYVAVALVFTGAALIARGA